ncbi:MAG TPA: hypothetical protein VF704_12565 [Allosphingosinicella sp.]
MAYRSDRLDDRIMLVPGHGMAVAAIEIRAGYGECRLCPDGYCGEFRGGSFDTHCGYCHHHKDDHR